MDERPTGAPATKYMWMVKATAGGHGQSILTHKFGHQTHKNIMGLDKKGLPTEIARTFLDYF
jgi:hypothetical protein